MLMSYMLQELKTNKHVQALDIRSSIASHIHTHSCFMNFMTADHLHCLPSYLIGVAVVGLMEAHPGVPLSGVLSQGASDAMLLPQTIIVPFEWK